MNGVRVVVHQSSSRSDSGKLFSMMASPSIAVVAEMAPRWMTASSLRPSSQRSSAAGGIKSAICRPARLRHLPSLPSISLTAISARPASLRLATTFDPIKPAPPVTNSIDRKDRFEERIGPSRPRRTFAPLWHVGQHPTSDAFNERIYIHLLDDVDNSDNSQS